MSRLQANLCLLCVTLCWSTEVIIFACIPDDVTPFATSCITSLIGAVLLFFLFFSRVRAALREHAREIISRAVFLGVINCSYNILYQFGLKSFNVSSGAFTLALTVAILPFVLLAQRASVDRRTWISGILVLIGIIFGLSATVRSDQLGGLVLIVIGCLLRVIYIIKISEYARQYDPVSLSALMSLAVGIITYIPWTITSPRTFAAITWSRTAIASLAIYAYFLVVFAQTLNFFAQKRTTASNATIIYSTEIVFSIIWGAFLPSYMVDRVPITPMILIGVLFVVAGNIVEIVDLPFLRRLEKPDGEGSGLASEAEDAVVTEPTPQTEMPAAAAHTYKTVGFGSGKFVSVLNLAVGYLLIAVPFKVLSVIPGFTDVRPVTLLGPAYAIFFGIPGCLVMAFGNLFMDIVSDSLRWSSIAGFAANFLGPFVIYLYWTRISRSQFSLRTGKNLLKCVGIIILSAVVEAVLITPMVAAVYPDVDAWLFAVSVLLNTSAFPIFFGMPFMMILQDELELKPRYALR